MERRKRKSLNPRKNISDVVALLKDPDFYKDCKTILTARPTDGPYPMTPEEFFAKWGAFPPRNFALLRPNDPRKEADAILAGQWGLIPVYPWTTEGEIRKASVKTRRGIEKRHRDARGIELGRLADWLSTSGFSTAEIAKEIFGRKRPSVSFREEQRVFRSLKGRDLSYTEIEARVSNTIRGRSHSHEKQVGMAIKRFRAFDAKGKMLREAPAGAEPISHAVTMLLRHTYIRPDAKDVVRWLEALRSSLLGRPTP